MTEKMNYYAIYSAKKCHTLPFANFGDLTNHPKMQVKSSQTPYSGKWKKFQFFAKILKNGCFFGSRILKMKKIADKLSIYPRVRKRAYLWKTCRKPVENLSKTCGKPVENTKKNVFVNPTPTYIYIRIYTTPTHIRVY